MPNDCWTELLDELNDLPIAPEETEVPLRSDEHCVCYGVRLTSWGPYRIFGYLSIPRAGDGPFPAYYYHGRFASVVEAVPQGLSVDVRRECVTFFVACRGQRNSDKPFSGPFPGMLTAGIDRPETYPLRGWAADCIRGLQYLQSRAEVDGERIAGVGYSDFSLHTAALHGGLCCVVSTPGLLYRVRELAGNRRAYPLEEYNDYLRLHPDRAEALYQTVDRLDPLHIADRVDVPTLLWGGLPWGLHPVDDLRPLGERIGPHAELRENHGSRSQDGIYQERWLARHLGLSEPALPEHWRS